MLGVGDVDFMDPNLSYYSGGYLALRLWSRQLVTFPAIAGKATTVVPDLATQLPTVANGGISKDGLTYKFTIRTGAMWNTSPARQVTAADMVRGVKRTCNPGATLRWAARLPDADRRPRRRTARRTRRSTPSRRPRWPPTRTATTSPGSSVDPANPQTVVFKLAHPAAYFVSMVSLCAFSARLQRSSTHTCRPAPSSPQHTISDGPVRGHQVQPGARDRLRPQPGVERSTDPVRKAYVDKVHRHETGDQSAIQQQLQAEHARTPTWSGTPSRRSRRFAAAGNAKDPNFYLGPTFASNPYVCSTPSRRTTAAPSARSRSARRCPRPSAATT